jgi:hypothetical protein
VGSLTIQTVDVGSLTEQTVDVGSLTIQTVDVGSFTIETETSTVTAPPVEVTLSYTAFVTTTITALTSKCDFCKVDIYGTELIYPTELSTTIIYATTVGLYPTVGVDSSTTTRTSLTTATNCCPEPSSTWLWNNIEL